MAFFPTVMRSSLRTGHLVVALAVLGGCHARSGCDEFAPPPDLAPKACPSKPAPVAATKPTSYCYQTIGQQSDCYAEPQPDRPGLIGTYAAPQN